jgi:dihydropteroate synthase
MQANPSYEDVVADVAAFLHERVAAAVAAGIANHNLVIDPGFGFGKTADHNLELIARLDELVRLGPPVLVGLSRKRFIGATLDIDHPQDRLFGSLAGAAAAVLAGARLVRTHDVKPTLDVIRMGQAITTWRRGP